MRAGENMAEKRNPPNRQRPIQVKFFVDEKELDLIKQKMAQMSPAKQEENKATLLIQVQVMMKKYIAYTMSMKTKTRLFLQQK